MYKYILILFSCFLIVGCGCQKSNEENNKNIDLIKSAVISVGIPSSVAIEDNPILGITVNMQIGESFKLIKNIESNEGVNVFIEDTSVISNSNYNISANNVGKTKIYLKNNNNEIISNSITVVVKNEE